MAIRADIAALIGRFDAATDEVASDLQRLRDGAVNHTMTLDEIATALAAPIARLETLGQDQDEPVPPTPPTP